MASADVAALHRSSVHILLSDKDSKSREDVFDLLRECSYQVTPVEHARQALEVLRSGRLPVDLILADVELPKGKGYKMLKHMMKEEKLKHIPVIMMSSKDEVGIVVKCLRLGVSDFLMKPLRTNELLNLWTHMWRKKKASGLLERRISTGFNVNNPPLDLFCQEPSESNTTSTDLFSDEADERKREQALAISEVGRQEIERKEQQEVSEEQNNQRLLDGSGKCEGTCSPHRRSSEFRTGQSSAFVNFSEISKNTLERGHKVSSNILTKPHFEGPWRVCQEKNELPASKGSIPLTSEAPVRNSSQSRKSSDLLDRTTDRTITNSTSGRPGATGVETSPYDSNLRHTVEEFEPVKSSYYRQEHGDSWPQGQYSTFLRDNLGTDRSNEPWSRRSHTADRIGPPSFYPHQQFSVLKYRMPPDAVLEMGAMLPPPPPTPVHIRHMMPPQISGLSHPMHPLFHGAMMQPDPPAMVPPIHHHQLALHHGQPYSVYPPAVIGGMSPSQQMMQPGSHLIGPHAQGCPPSWSPMHLSLNERKLELAEQREAALNKFRQKRKDRCFKKKIRYATRKRLAEQRPRNRGQFVKQTGKGEKDEEDSAEEEEDYEDDEDGASSPE